MTNIVPDNTTEPATTQPKEEVKIASNAVESASTEVAQEAPEDPNWKAFREGRKKDRQDKEAAEKRAHEKAAEASALKAALEAALDKRPLPTQPNQPYYNESYTPEESEDERIEKKVMAAIAAKEAEFNRQRAQREEQEYPQRLVQSYSDFNQVVNQENLDYLEYHYPEVARAFQNLPNNYQKWEDVYKSVKRFVPNAATGKKDAARAEANLMRPKSISSIGATQTKDDAGSQNLSDDRKRANWERMQKTLRGVS